MAITQPGIGGLYLVAVDDALMEHAVLIAQTISIRGQRQGSQRVEEAGGEPPQAAVAEASVPLRLAQVFEFVAKLVHRFRRRTEEAKV